MQDILDKIYEYLATYGLQVIAAIVIFVVGRWIAKLIVKLVGKLMVKANVDKVLVNFVQNLCYIAFFLNPLSPTRIIRFQPVSIKDNR